MMTSTPSARGTTLKWCNARTGQQKWCKRTTFMSGSGPWYCWQHAYLSRNDIARFDERLRQHTAGPLTRRRGGG